MGNISERNKIRKRVEISYHSQQADVFNNDTRFKIIVCGRRWGKTRGSINWLTEKLLENKKKKGWWVAPTYSQAKIGFQYFKTLFLDIVKYKNETELRVVLYNDSILEFKSADKPDNLRGEGIDFLVLDECEVMKREVWETILRPAIMDSQGQVCFIGTPKGQNWFYELYLKGLDETEKDYKSWRYDSYGNTYISPEEIDKAKKDMPERLFRQEILAEFLEDIGSVFRGVRDCAIGSFEEPVPSGEYFMGVDLGKYEDFTVLTVVRRMESGLLKVVAFDRFKDISWRLQEQRILNLANKYHPYILIDLGQVGDKIFEDLQMKYSNIDGIRFTNENKIDMINFLSKLIEEKQVIFPDIPELVEELRIFEYETTKSGKLRMNAPAGYHDDCVISLALACYPLQKIKAEFDAFGEDRLSSRMFDDEVIF